MIEKDGLAALNTNAIAKRAGVSIGSPYQFFPGKQAILATLIRDMRRDMLADIRDAVEHSEGKDLRLALGALIDGSLRHHLRNPALAEALEQAEEQLPMDAETQALKANISKFIVGMLDDHGIDAPQTTARDLLAMCHGLVRAAIKAGEADFDDLAIRVRRAAFGYLGL